MEINDDIITLKTQRMLKIRELINSNKAFIVHVIGVTMKIKNDGFHHIRDENAFLLVRSPVSQQNLWRDIPKGYSFY